MAYLARTVTPADGSETTFPVSFPLSPLGGREDVEVLVHALGADVGSPKIEGTDFSWVSDGELAFTAPPTAGLLVDIRRETGDGELDNTLQPGGALQSSQLVQNDTQLLFLIQEREDAEADLQFQIDNGVGPKGDPGSPGEGFPTRAAMAARPTPAVLDDVFLTEKGREGKFIVALTSDWTAMVAADATAQGMFVVSTADPTKVYVRLVGNAPYNPTWWGLLVGDTSGNAAGNTAAFSAMLTSLAAISATTGLGLIRMPQGIIWMADNGAGAAVDLQNGLLNLEGMGAPLAGGAAAGTLIKLLGAISGVRVQSGDTTGGTADGASQQGGASSLLRNFGVLGNYTNVESEAHGIHLRGTGFAKNVTVTGMPGDGFHINANDAAGDGNANCFRVEDCVAANNRNNFYADGSDANAGTFQNCLGTGARQWDYWDSSLLGNKLDACLAESFTVPVGGSPHAGVSVSGNQYRVIPGQEVGASTNAPSGTTADNTWWFFVQAGGVSTIYEAWTSGHTYRAGGTYHNDNLNQKNAVYTGCYDESNGQISWLGNPAMVVGGFLSLSGNKSASNGWGPAAIINATNTAGSINFHQGLAIQPSRSGDTFSLTLGGESGQLNNTLINFSEPTLAPSGYTLTVDTQLGTNNLVLYDNIGFAPVYEITLPGSTAQFGTGVAQKDRFWPTNLVVGDTLADARLVTNGTVAPTTGAHGVGEIVLNRTPAASGATSNAGWKCTAAGTPGTWVAFGGKAVAGSATYVAATGGTTVDTQARASQAQLAADLADLKTKLQTAGITL